MLIPAMRAMSLLALTLLVPRVLADHEDRAVAADDLALLAHRLDRRSYLHDPFRLGDQRAGSGCREGRRYRSPTQAHRIRAHAETFYDSKGHVGACVRAYGTSMGTYDDLLRRFQPALRYDSMEQFFADSAAQWTDNPGNELRRANTTDGRPGELVAVPPT